MNSKPTIIFLMGPTASGKTALASALYQQAPIELISVDSALIYRGMDIGTAKPNAQELRDAPHRLIDIRDPAEIYSAADFRRDALIEIEQIINQDKIPLLVGGTMLYFKALLEGLSPLPSADHVIRAEIEDSARLLGWQKLHQQLAEIDPIAAQRIHPNDPQRISRALEVYLISGQNMSSLLQQSGQSLPYNVIQLAMPEIDRSILHQRIEQRFKQMLVSGFQQEVETLFERGDLNPDLPSIRSVGYRQMWQYLAQEISYDEMIFRAICATRQLAKRQITWLRGWDDLHWLSNDNSHDVLKLLKL